MIPDDLKHTLEQYPNGIDRYHALKDGEKRRLLYGIYTAKNPATRQRRVEALVELCLGK